MSALDDYIANLRDMPNKIKQLAPGVADAIREVAKAELAAGHGIGGDAWEPTKEGKTPLKGAADSIDVRAVGTVILISFTGTKWYYRFHQSGKTKMPARPVLYTGGIPPAIKAAISKSIRDQLEAG